MDSQDLQADALLRVRARRLSTADTKTAYLEEDVDVGREAQLTIDGELSVFEDRGESGDAVYVWRKFCGSCGSPIISTFVEPPGIVALKAGTLDDTSSVAPQAQYWTAHKQDWVDLPGLQATETE